MTDPRDLSALDAQAVAAELRPTNEDLDLSTPRRVHIIGTGGAGMRAIARVLLDGGHAVSGSDLAASVHLDALRARGAAVYAGSRPDFVASLPGTALVTRSTAVPDTDAEVVAVSQAGLEVANRAATLRAITATRSSILVAGTHGKTTTSSLLSVLLDHAAQSELCATVSSPPSFVVGADIAYFGTGARWTGTDQSDLAVIEADESDGTFLSLHGAHAIVTSLDPDHLEFYGSRDRLMSAFEAFVDSIPGTCAVFSDDDDTAHLVGRDGVITYGTGEADLRLSEIAVGRNRTSFDVTWRGEALGRAMVALPGKQNAYNAGGALAIALSLGVPFAVAVAGLARFSGVQRRYEWRGQVDGITFIDDYAHLPAEVEAALATARKGGWRRVVATYQPHRYSRTQAHGRDFARSFGDADQLVLTDIYPSGEKPRPGVTGKILVDAVTQADPDRSIEWRPTLDDVIDYLDDTLRPGDLCLTLGAGDLTSVPDAVLERRRATGESRRDALAARLAAALPDGTVRSDADLGALTTYRVGGTAAMLVEVESQADLQAMIPLLADSMQPVMIVGRGSNMLVSDAGFDGVVIVLGDVFEEIVIESGVVVAGGAAFLPVVARQTVAAGLTGFEWAVGVPGSIGGAVAMNAGGHGSDMAASIAQVETINLRSGELHTWSLEELTLRYRSSALTSDDCVLRCTLSLDAASDGASNATDQTSGNELLSEIVRWRREHQPGGQNAGSVFTNPPGDSAGRLIDVAGCKGLRVGSAMVSTKHANFFQADPDGSADDIYELMHLVHDIVLDASGISLTPETRLLGFAPFGMQPPTLQEG